MNKVRDLGDGDWVMEIDVDGKMEERPCFHDEPYGSKSLAGPTLVPELKDNERRIDMPGNNFKIITMWRERE